MSLRVDAAGAQQLFKTKHICKSRRQRADEATRKNKTSKNKFASTKTKYTRIIAMLMKDKKGLIMGVANDRSIAWGIAKAIAKQGGQLAFTYQSEVLKKRVLPLAQSIGSDILIPCDVTDTLSIKKTFEILKNKWGKLDFLVHGVAFSNKDELKGKYYKTSFCLL